jgi:ornithine decarboxylase
MLHNFKDKPEVWFSPYLNKLRNELQHLADYERKAIVTNLEMAGVVKVEKRRGSELFINDGAYGSLFDAAHIGWRFPVALQRSDTSIGTQMAEFSFYGPTCDDMDHMAGPFILPDDVQAGDYIEIGMLGAYGCAMRTEFNGFGETETLVVEDEPMATLYGWAPANDAGVRATRSQSSKV